MSSYIFATTAMPKNYNYNRFWLEEEFIKPKRIKAASVEAALLQYSMDIQNAEGVSISKNAIKNKTPMYLDIESGSVQVGWVITASVYIENSVGAWKKQYIDLWIQVEETNFPEF